MKHLVCTDLHGQKKIYDKLMESIGTEQYTIYYLGDAVDRGAHGYEIMKSLLNDPNVIYIKGNHEDLFIKSAREFMRLVNEYAQGNVSLMLAACKNNINTMMMYGNDMNLHEYNGGAPTLAGWINDGCPMDIIERLEKLPTHASYKNFDMCHAGCRVDEFDKEITDSLIWSREHFNSSWKSGRTLLFGHTPTPILDSYGVSAKISDDEARPFEFSLYENKGRKIDLDCGAFFSKHFAVYDMDADNYTIIAE